MRLPANRAFLIRLGVESETGADPLIGKVEHVQSGESARFASLDELRAFVVQFLEKQNAETDRETTPRGTGHTT